MTTDSPKTTDPADDGLAALPPAPVARDLPAGRLALHEERLMALIDNENRATAQRPAAPRRYNAWLRPVLVTSALAAAVITGAVVVNTWDSGPASSPNAKSVPSAPGSATPGQQKPPVGKMRGFETVQDLTAAADLVVHGTVVAASGSGDSVLDYRVEEVLYAADGSPVTAGDRITLAQLDSAIPDAGGMSRLEPGQQTVLYLVFDGENYRPLSGDFGIFDVAGDTATARSLAMSVRGLRTVDPDTAQDRKFTAPLGDLTSVARERTAAQN